MRIKKLLLKVIVFTGIISIVVGGGINASAESFFDLDYARYVSIPDISYGTNKNTTNIGGIAISENGSNQEMYVIKTNNNTEAITTLYYRPHINSAKNDYITIKLTNIAGHGNSMTIGRDNIFITRWQSKRDGEKSDIVQISRNAIRKIYINAKKKKGFENGQLAGEINANNSAVTIINTIRCLNTAQFDKDYTTSSLSNTSYKSLLKKGYIKNYTGSISAITKYTPHTNNSSANITNYLKGNNFIVKSNITNEYYKARLLNIKGEKVLMVSTDKSNTFYVENNASKVFTSDEVTPQNIHYDPNKGFFVCQWNNNVKIVKTDKVRYGVKNTISYYNVDPFTKNSRIKPYQYYRVTGASSYSKFEIESLTFTTSKNSMLLSVNAEKKSGGMSDDQVIKITSNVSFKIQ